MSTTIFQITSPIFPGYGLSDGKLLPCTGASGTTIGISSFTPNSNYNSFHHFRNVSLICNTRSNSCLFSSGSDIYRRNPNSNREEDKAKFSNRLVDRQKNKTYTQNEDDDYSSENLEDPEHLSSRNGSLSYSKSPSSLAPLDKEKKAIALFREVQARIRAKSVQVEKIEGLSKPKKESNRVVSLVEILRKYSVPPIERSSSSGKVQDGVGKGEPLAGSSLHSSFRSNEVNEIVNSENENFENDDEDREDQIVNPDETESLVYNRAILDEIAEDEAFESDEEDNEDEDFESDEEDSEDETDDSDETEPFVLNRAIFEEISQDGAFESDEEDSKDEAFENDEEDSEDEAFESDEEDSADEAFESDEEDSEDEIVDSDKTKPFTLSRAIIEEISEDKAFDSEDETVDSDEKEPFVLNRAIFEEIYKDFESDENDDGKQEKNRMVMIDSREFSKMKLTELRALAKSRGIKGFSKMKKGELTELLIGDTVR